MINMLKNLYVVCALICFSGQLYAMDPSALNAKDIVVSSCNFTNLPQEVLGWWDINETDEVFVVRSNESFLGGLICDHEADSPESVYISSVRIIDSAQRQGIGGILIQKFIQKMKLDRVSAVCLSAVPLSSNEDNKIKFMKDLVRFYRGHGFTRDDGHEGETDDDFYYRSIDMTLKLS